MGRQISAGMIRLMLCTLRMLMTGLLSGAQMISLPMNDTAKGHPLLSGKLDSLKSMMN